MTMHSYLESAGVATAWLDARDVLVVEQTGFASASRRQPPRWSPVGEDGGARHRLVRRPDAVGPVVVGLHGRGAHRRHRPLAATEGTPTTLKRSGPSATMVYS